MSRSPHDDSDPYGIDSQGHTVGVGKPQRSKDKKDDATPRTDDLAKGLGRETTERALKIAMRHARNLERELTVAQSAVGACMHPNAEQALALAREIEDEDICKDLVYEDRGVVVDALRALGSAPQSATAAPKDSWSGELHPDYNEAQGPFR